MLRQGGACARGGGGVNFISSHDGHFGLEGEGVQCAIAPPPSYGVCISMHLLNGTGNSPSSGRPTPGIVKHNKSSGGCVDTTKTRSGPQRVRMSSGERPTSAAKGKQSDTEALCQTPPSFLWRTAVLILLRGGGSPAPRPPPRLPPARQLILCELHLQGPSADTRRMARPGPTQQPCSVGPLGPFPLPLPCPHAPIDSSGGAPVASTSAGGDRSPLQAGPCRDHGLTNDSKTTFSCVDHQSRFHPNQFPGRNNSGPATSPDLKSSRPPDRDCRRPHQSAQPAATGSQGQCQAPLLRHTRGRCSTHHSPGPGMDTIQHVYWHIPTNLPQPP